MNLKPINITKLGHKKMRLLNEKKQRKKKWWRKPTITWFGWKKPPEKQVSNFEELEFEKCLNVNQWELNENLIVWTK